jgi:hypothetical protein
VPKLYRSHWAQAVLLLNDVRAGPGRGEVPQPDGWRPILHTESI